MTFLWVSSSFAPVESAYCVTNKWVQVMTMRTSFKYLILCNAFACFAQSTAKLVARGIGFKDESITVDFKNDATIFSIR